MLRRYKPTILVLALVVTFAVGLARLVSAQTPPAHRPPGTPRPNPEAGLTDAQRHQNHAAQSASWDAERIAALDSFTRSHSDPRKLPRYDLPGVFVSAKPTLQAALSAADLVVVGKVVSVQWQLKPDQTIPTGVTTFAVERTLQGSPAASVLVVQHGGPDLDNNAQQVLAQFDNAPILLPGDRALLLLQRSHVVPGAYEIQSYSGWYQLGNQLVTVLSLVPFRADIANLTEGQFTTAISQLTSRTATPPPAPATAVPSAHP